MLKGMLMYIACPNLVSVHSGSSEVDLAARAEEAIAIAIASSASCWLRPWI